MNFNDLGQIICISEEGSISLAAKKLYMSQPSLSQTIKRVEQGTGYRLFDRVSTGIILTREGENFVKIAQQIMSLRTELTVKLKEVADNSVNRMTIGLPAFFSSGVLSDALGEFCRLYPNVEVTIKDAFPAQLEHMLLKGEVDIAIMQPDIFSSKIEHRVFICEEMLLAVSPKNCIASLGVSNGAAYPTIDTEVLKRETFILCYTNIWMRQFANEFFVSSNFEPQCLMLVNDIETIKQLTLKNLGVSFIPTSYVQNSPDKKMAYFSIPDNSLPKWTLITAYLKANGGNKMIGTFVELLSSHVQKTVDPSSFLSEYDN